MSTRTGGLLGRLPDGSDAYEGLIAKRHDQYFRNAKRFKALYYGTRILAMLPGVFLPLAAWTSPVVALILSGLVAVAVAIDSIFTPKDRWVLYSKASDRLAVAQLKASGQYEKWKEELRLIEETESEALIRLTDIRDLTGDKPSRNKS